MADVAGNGCTSADASLRCNTQELNPRSLGSLEERANRASEPSDHVLVRPRSWNSMPVGMGGGRSPPFGAHCRSDRPATLLTLVPYLFQMLNRSWPTEGVGLPQLRLERKGS